jgi:hypothetical protein
MQEAKVLHHGLEIDFVVESLVQRQEKSTYDHPQMQSESVGYVLGHFAFGWSCWYVFSEEGQT